MPEGLEGFTETVKRKRLTVYFRGSKKHLEELLEHELTHSFEFEVLNEETHEGEDIPLWFIEGVAEHNSRSWDSDYDMTMRAAYLANAIAPLTEKEFPRMFQVYIEGHLASNFIYDTCKNGPASDPIKEILYKSRSSPFENAVKDTCGFSLKDLDRKFQGYLEKRYGHLKGKEEVTAKSSELTDGLLSGASDYFFTSQKWILGRETFFLHFKNGGEIINKKIAEEGKSGNDSFGNKTAIYGNKKYAIRFLLTAIRLLSSAKRKILTRFMFTRLAKALWLK